MSIRVRRCSSGVSHWDEASDDDSGSGDDGVEPPEPVEGGVDGRLEGFAVADVGLDGEHLVGKLVRRAGGGRRGSPSGSPRPGATSPPLQTSSAVTRIPCRQSSATVAAPIPRAAPVTRATRSKPIGRHSPPSARTARRPPRRSLRSGRRAPRWARPCATPCALRSGRRSAIGRGVAGLGPVQADEPRRQVQHQGGLGATGVGVTRRGTGDPVDVVSFLRSCSDGGRHGVDVAAVPVDQDDASRPAGTANGPARPARCRSASVPMESTPGKPWCSPLAPIDDCRSDVPAEQLGQLASDRGRDQGVGLQGQVRAVLLGRADRHEDEGAFWAARSR